MPDPLIPGASEPFDPDPVESFQNMNKEIDESAPSEPIGEPVLPCKQPWVEIWLFDNQPSTVGLAECEITLPTGKSRTGTLDPSGYLKIDDFDVDDPDLENTMALGVVQDSGKLELKFTRDTPVKEEKGEEEPDVPEVPPLYFKPPFPDELEDD